MKSLYFVHRGRLEWRDRPDLRITDPRQAIVKPIVVGRCDLDYFIILGLTPFKPPFAIGHELAGEVVETGSEVHKVKKGDRVVVPFHISCGHCRTCSHGIPAFCSSVQHGAAYGLSEFGDFGGTVSDYTLIPYADSMLHIIPDSVSALDAAACSDNLSDAWRTVVPYLDTKEQKRILIVGGTSLGLYAVMIAKAFHQDVDYYDSDETRLKMAEMLGARLIRNSETPKQRYYQITVDSGSTEKSLASAITSVEPGGVCTSTSIHFSNITIPYWEMYNTDVTLKIGRAQAGNYIPAILKMIEDGALSPSQLITKVIDYKDAAKGYKERTVKLAVVRDS